MKIPVSLFLALVSSPLFGGWTPFTQTARIDNAAYQQVGPVVASNGFDFLAGWETAAPGNGSTWASAQRVNADGSLAGDLPVVLNAATSGGISVAPARDGYLVAGIVGGDLVAAISDSYGRIERQTTLTHDPAGPQTFTASSGGVHLVIAGFDGPFTAWLVDDNANVIASAIPVGDAHGELTSFAATSDSQGFVVFSTKANALGGSDIDGRRISTSGVAGDWFLVRSGVNRVYSLAAAGDTIAWGDKFGVWMMPIGGASRQLRPEESIVTDVLVEGGRTWIAYQVAPYGPQQAFAIAVEAGGSIGQPIALPGRSKLASNGSRILAASLSAGPLDSDVSGTFLDRPNAPFLIAKSRTDQSHGDLASDGKTTIAVWDETIGASRNVFAARFAPNALDPVGVQISTSTDNVNPAVAFNGQEALIVWIRDDKQIVARRFSADGRVLDSEDIVIGDAFYGAPRVVWDGANWFVVWIGALKMPGCANFGTATRVFGAHVSPGGSVLEPGGVPIDPHPSTDQIDVDLAWSGSQYMLVWTNLCYSRYETLSDIGIAALTPDLKNVRVSIASTSGLKPKIAAGADRSLVAWSAEGRTYFRVVDNSLPSETARRRVFVGQSRTFPSIAGALIAVTPQSVVTQTTIPWASSYQGIFETPIAADGSAGTGNFWFVLEPTETLMGHLVAQNGTKWIAESMLNSIFDPDSGAQRLWLRGNP